MYVPALIVGVVKISEALPSSVLEANGNHHCGTARCRNKSGSLSSRGGSSPVVVVAVGAGFAVAVIV